MKDGFDMWTRDERIWVNEHNLAFKGGQRNNLTIEVYNVENAGRHGKKVQILEIPLPYAQTHAVQDKMMNLVIEFFDQAMHAKDLKEIEFYALDLQARRAMTMPETFRSAGKPFYYEEKRGYDVEVPNVAISIEGKGWSLTCDLQSFYIRDLEDLHNAPVMIPSPYYKKGAQARKFHKLLQANTEKVKSLTMRELATFMWDNGVRYHSYCSND